MEIRKATLADLEEIVRIGESFHAYCPYAEIPFDPVAFREFCARLIEGGVIFLSSDGMIGGLLSPLYFNPSISGAAELFWYARDGGRELREAFETWGKEAGAQIIQFSGLVNEREAASRRLFRAAGYRATEVAFMKRVA